MIKAYLKRDVGGLRRIGEESGGGGAKARRQRETFARRVLFERNVRMAARAEPWLREGGAFIAVGALHLHGERGLLALLEQRGWRVIRVY